jgi:hypothetical protein
MRVHNAQYLIVNGLLVVMRINYFVEPKYQTEPIKPALDLEHEEILNRYRGIEGEPWLLEPPFEEISSSGGLARIERYKDILEYYNALSKECLCDLLYLSSSVDLPLIDKLPEQLSFCGYDYGMYLSEYNNYSVIFNEVIYGSIDKLRKFSGNLNEHLLLPSLDRVLELERQRSLMVESGVGLALETTEEGECFGPIAIYGIKKEYGLI